MLASRDQNMEITEIEIKTPKEVFEEKIRELCHAITDHKEFKEMCSNIDGFMSDEKAKFEFQMLNEMGALLQQKQEMGGEVTEEEAGRFESLRDSFTANEAAMKFVATQEKVQKMQEHILRHVQKTFELGRVPSSEEMEEGTCCDCTCGFEESEGGSCAL
jgi:cell fate (sporulation/competence/biofilm development) regulator YlbF (YheA/YmcA/DUF963 family)